MDSDIAALVAELASQAAAVHPAVGLGPARFARELAARVPDGSDPRTALAGLRVADLYLACAAAAGDPFAVSATEPQISSAVDAAAMSLGVARSLADEVKQRLREHFLVGTSERPPALADFAGRGDLGGFLRISATRECLRLLRGAKREVGMGEEDLAYYAPVVDPELERMKGAYRAQFSECFVEALRGLTPRERTLLRHHSIDRLTIDQIGALYGAHRATAARWLERAREKIAARTEELLAARLSMDEVEVASVIRLVRSQLHVTLERVLGEE